MAVTESIRKRNFELFGDERPVALVTGSVARVGLTVARFLAAEGFRLVLHSHRSSDAAKHTVDQMREDGLDCILVCGAVEDENLVADWLTMSMSHYGRIDALVNSAAIWDPKPLEATTAADFKRCFDVNALGTVLICKHFGLQMTRQPCGGAIVNIGDWAVLRPYREFAAYFASKGTIECLTRSMAVELATRNPRVRVNAVLPGPVLLADGISPERRQQIISESLLKREGTPKDVAHAVVFLLTSPFVTGVCVPVDGGRTIYAGASADPHAHPSA